MTGPDGAEQERLDDALMERLRRIAATVDPPPALVEAAARAALTTRRLDAELAELVLDSELATAGAVRAEPGEQRLLSFESGAVAVELQVRPDGPGLALTGLVAGGSGALELETADGRRRVDVDGHGWFSVAGVAPGPARVHLTAAGGAAVTSAWVLL